MIRLKQLIFEINMADVHAYKTAFQWRRIDNKYDSKFVIDDVNISMVMTLDSDSTSNWSFAFYLPSNTHGKMTTNRNIAAPIINASYMRILLTCAYAIRDFADTFNANRIEISGVDSQFGKDTQKTRIYHELMQANATLFADFKLHKSFNGQRLFLIRIRQTDASGIEDTP